MFRIRERRSTRCVGAPADELRPPRRFFSDDFQDFAAVDDFVENSADLDLAV